MPSNQCPISKAQCKQLLAFLNLGAIVGDAYHAASVSTSCIATSGERASGSTSGALSLRHNVSNCLLFSIQELLLVMHIMLQV